VIASEVEELNEMLHLSPGIGNFGDRYWALFIFISLSS
jgi:uracil phosphoribosyltransferase